MGMGKSIFRSLFGLVIVIAVVAVVLIWISLRHEPPVVLVVTDDAAIVSSPSDNETAVVDTRLHWAVANGDIELCKNLIRAGADVNAEGFEDYLRKYGEYIGEFEVYDGETPLSIAAKKGYNTRLIDGITRERCLDICKFLLEAGADARVVGSPLHRAVILGQTEVCQHLLSSGTDANTKDDRGGTPLHWAVICGHLDICKLLVGNGAEVNASDHKGDTPLYCAVRTGHLDK